MIRSARRFTVHVVPLALLVCSCGSTQEVTGPDSDDLIWEVEDKLVAAEEALSNRDRTTAEQLLNESRAILDGPELANEPDRHQLIVFHRELTRRAAGTPFYEAPKKEEQAPVVVAASPVIKQRPAPEVVAVAEAPEQSAVLPSPDDLFGEDPKPAVKSTKSAKASFRAGPLKDHKKGLRLLAKAKRVRSKKRRVKLWEKAEAALSACESEGSALLDEHPPLKRMRFKTGRKKLPAARITKKCRVKAKWVQRKLERRRMS